MYSSKYIRRDGRSSRENIVSAFSLMNVRSSDVPAIRRRCPPRCTCACSRILFFMCFSRSLGSLCNSSNGISLKCLLICW